MLIGNYNAQYIGKTMCGFIKGHKYNIDIDKCLYGYIISGLIDRTLDADASAACINYASETSIRRNWKIEGD